MKPYMLVEGSNNQIDTFEEKIANALEMGYTLSGELVTQPISSSEIKFFQSLLLIDDEEDEDFDDEDEEDDE